MVERFPCQAGREGMLLARGFGVTKPQILESISWGAFRGGHESLNLVDQVARDVLAAWSALPGPGRDPLRDVYY